MKTSIKTKVKHCGKCDSTELEWIDTEYPGGSIGYRFICKKCDSTGIEWHNLVYDETVMD